jgi:hypothetical protein
MAFFRFNRDKRGYEHFYLVEPVTNRRGKTRPRVLYWYRTPPNIKVGRVPFDAEVQRALEAQNPNVVFDWRKIIDAPIPSADVEKWRERRRAERADKAARRATGTADAAEAPAAAAEAVEPDIEDVEAADGAEIGEASADEIESPDAVMATESIAAPTPNASADPNAIHKRRRRRRRGRRPDSPAASETATAPVVLPSNPVEPTGD